MPAPNRLFAELETVSRLPDYLDLVDSDFHKNGALPPPEVFLSAFQDYLQQRNYTPWSRGSPAAQTALSEFYREQGVDLPPQSVLLTSGTSEAYRLIFDAFCRPGDEVLVSRPGYPLFEELLKAKGLTPAFYQMKGEKGFSIDSFSLEASCSAKTRLLILISPHNPTGKVFTASEIQTLGLFCRERNLILVVDEVFDIFYYGPGRLPRPAALLPRQPVITLNGISKRFASPDLKLAWMAVTGPLEWTEPALITLETLNDLFLGANSYSAFLLPRLFGGLQEFQKDLVHRVGQNRVTLSRISRPWKSVQVLLQEGGIHFILKLSAAGTLTDEEMALRLLREKHTLFHPGYLYDCPEGHLVGSFLKGGRDFEQGLKRLESFLFIDKDLTP